MVQFKSPDQFIEQANKRIGDEISGFLRLPTSFWDQHVSSDSDAGPPPTIHGTPLTTAMASGAPKRLGTFVYPTPARRVSRSLKDLLYATNKSIVDMLSPRTGFSRIGKACNALGVRRGLCLALASSIVQVADRPRAKPMPMSWGFCQLRANPG